MSRRRKSIINNKDSKGRQTKNIFFSGGTNKRGGGLNHYQYSKQSSHEIKLNRRIAIYRPFHKTLPRSSAIVNWISVRFYETDCSLRTTIYHYT